MIFKHNQNNYPGLPRGLFTFNQRPEAMGDEAKSAAAAVSHIICAYVGEDYKGYYNISPRTCNITITITSLDAFNALNRNIKKVIQEIQYITDTQNVQAFFNGSQLKIIVPLKLTYTLGFQNVLLPDNNGRILPLDLGIDNNGDVLALDLAKLPHLLVAGATGSGKSVCLNSIILNLLRHNSPNQLNLILIDPKKTEFAQYSKLPHLIGEVVNTSEATLIQLTKAVEEMRRRYSLMSRRNVRDLSADPGLFPRLAIIIDELAGLMLDNKKDTEKLISLLAEQGRACGIHLIIATQYPSVKVITGKIKANIPARIAFKTATISDSRTILDLSGAEKLTGCGDALYKSPIDSNFVRFQTAFISTEEVQKAVTYIRKGGKL